MFYSDAGLPTLCRDNRIISRNVTLINTLHHSLNTLLYTNPLSLLSGYWFSRRWVNARAAEWFTLAVEAAFQATLSATQTIHKPLTECLLEDWRASWMPPPPGDPRHHFTPGLIPSPIHPRGSHSPIPHLPIRRLPTHHWTCVRHRLLSPFPSQRRRQHQLSPLR